MTLDQVRTTITLLMMGIDTEKAPVIYVSGKVTGLAPEEVKTNFEVAQKNLEAQGYAVFNPATALPIECDWQMAMRVCVSVLPACDAIYMLDNWIDSKGAKEELRIAEMLGLTVYGATPSLTTQRIIKELETIDQEMQINQDNHG